MLCKCHWIVLYTVHFTAFCLGGRFFPGHGVVQCYMLVSGPHASFTATVITAGVQVLWAVNMRPNNDAKRKFSTNLLPTTKKCVTTERHQCQERCGSTDRSRQTEQRRHRQHDHSVPREPPSSPRASASLYNHFTSHLSHLYNRRHLTLTYTRHHLKHGSRSFTDKKSSTFPGLSRAP